VKAVAENLVVQVDMVRPGLSFIGLARGVQRARRLTQERAKISQRTVVVPIAGLGVSAQDSVGQALA
jgi:hypothetical protein